MEEIVNVKSQLKISLPIAFESLINILMTLVDTLVISTVGTKELAKLINLIDKGTISSKIAKTVFEEMFGTGKDPEVIVKEKGLVQISDEGEIKKIVEDVVNNNPQSIIDYKDYRLRFTWLLL